MSSFRKNYSPKDEVLNFTYPRLHTGKSWYIDFKSYDPATGTMKRKKYMLDHVLKIKERRQQAAEMIDSIIKLLRSGWSPWVNVEDNRGYTMLDEALRKYEAYLEKQPKKKTRQSYSSRLNVLREYISLQVIPPRYVYQFNSSFVSDFLDWLYFDREVSGRTRNNYRGWCSSLASFFIEREYIVDNPVTKIKTVPEDAKKRQPLTDRMLHQLHHYLEINNRMFLLACQMEYYTFIRPEELSNIKIGDISVAEQSVFISATISKNKRDGKVGLNEDIIRLMIDLDVLSKPSTYYLFGDKLRPGLDKGSSEMFRRQWVKVRRALKWSNDYQFYSLKDSGIRDLANSKGIVIARDQARHSDIATTNKYLQGRDKPIHEETKTFKGSL